MRSALTILLSLGALGIGGTASAQGLVAEPEVRVINATVDGSAMGTIVLRNTGTTTVIASEITSEPGCDAAVQAAPTSGFMLVPGDTRSIAVTCVAQPAGLRRCGYRVRSSNDTVLLAFEAVCTSADSTALVAQGSELAFGSVTVGSAATKPLRIDNNGATTIHRVFIETTDLAGNFTIAAPCNPDARACSAALAAVPAEGSTMLTVACTPRTPGLHTAQLHVVTATGDRLAAPIELSCTGQAATTPVLSASPSAIDVGAIEVMNANAAATVRITNAGAGTLQLLDVQIIDGGTGAASDWTAAVRAPCNSTVPPSCALDAGNSADIDLGFAPAAIGVRDATLLIHFRDTADRSTAIPLHAIGRGATLDLVGNLAGGPAGTATTLDFGMLPLNTSASLTFEVANRGTRPVRMGAVLVTPSGAPFTVSPGAMFTVDPAAPTSVTVTCRPVTEDVFTAQLQLSASDAVGESISLVLRCAGDADTALVATPPAILLGEVRTGTTRTVEVPVASTGAPRMITSFALEVANPLLSLTGAPGSTPTTFGLTTAPSLLGSLADRVVVIPASGPQLLVPVSGAAVTPDFGVPPTVSLGTFCVDQPTTPRIIQLDALGTGSIVVSEPALQDADSPFDLQLIAPLVYPATLHPGERAVIAATPRRRATATVAGDEVVWMTDIQGRAEARTKVTATFLADGGAIAPTSIAFGATPIHLDVSKPREVTLQNCDVSLLQLDPPQIGAPFTIDSPNFPTALQPGEIATFSVGFHPTTVAVDIMRTLVITSPQLGEPLVVTLTGTSFASGPDVDGGGTIDDDGRTSFYACGGCASSHDASGALVIAASVLVLRRRRPR